ncbi:putative PurR-regulated permease PerM [Fluviicoccus keumensis]|uniref:Putative PurR-regulated permease PerM n=1 Tax=Fluviicoccus keumensis TaxID=1435465 RepID=A0A4Q7YNI0_9GAMM|nr:AI-2E family transporter [Fluviicoccus keumensis]RZU38381.1 putative PurR-regulated permease PerM [Fluviicoccus keumensis]
MSTPQASAIHRALLIVVIALLMFLGYRVLSAFIVPMVWAGILAYVTWPGYQRLKRATGGPNRSAALMTVLLALVLVLPMAWGIYVLQDEAGKVMGRLTAQLSSGTLQTPGFIRTLPGIGHELEGFLDRLLHEPGALRAQLERVTQHVWGSAGAIAGGISRNAAKLGMTLVTLFFFYRDGEVLMAQIRTALQHLIGRRTNGYVQAAADMTRAVVIGIVLTALAQGFLAGVGYAVAGMDSPVFLAAITTLIALIPFGTPFAWGSVAIWLFAQGDVAAALGLAAWGTFVISWVDNIIRPFVISGKTHIPFLLVMFGVLGGLNAFGMVGLFLGPVILAVLVAVWRQWLEGEKAEA